MRPHVRLLGSFCPIGYNQQALTKLNFSLINGLGTENAYFKARLPLAASLGGPPQWSPVRSGIGVLYMSPPARSAVRWVLRFLQSYVK